MDTFWLIVCLITVFVMGFITGRLAGKIEAERLIGYWNQAQAAHKHYVYTQLKEAGRDKEIEMLKEAGFL